MRSQESNYMYSSFTKSTIKNQNTQLTEKSVGITIRMFPDYPIEKSQYPINKKISGYTQFTKISYLELWHISDIKVWNFNENLTINVVSFEQPSQSDHKSSSCTFELKMFSFFVSVIGLFLFVNVFVLRP